jgi:hypothetical protein
MKWFCSYRIQKVSTSCRYTWQRTVASKRPPESTDYFRKSCWLRSFLPVDIDQDLPLMRWKHLRAHNPWTDRGRVESRSSRKQKQRSANERGICYVSEKKKVSKWKSNGKADDGLIIPIRPTFRMYTPVPGPQLNRYEVDSNTFFKVVKPSIKFKYCPIPSLAVFWHTFPSVVWCGLLNSWFHWHYWLLSVSE